MLVKGDRIRVGFMTHVYDYGVLNKQLNEDIWSYAPQGLWHDTAVRLKLCHKISRLEELLYF